MIKCTCETRPVFNCLVHADRSMAHRQSVSRLAGLKQENAELEQQLDEAQADTRKHLDTVINQNSELLVLRAQLAALRLQTTECNGFDCCPLAPELAELREAARAVVTSAGNWMREEQHAKDMMALAAL